LTFGFEAIILIEVEIPSPRLVVKHELDESGSLEARLLMLEKLDKTRRRTIWNNEVTHVRKKARHGNLAKITTFLQGNLVMLVDSWLMK
jgi:hypothetical protein